MPWLVEGALHAPQLVSKHSLVPRRRSWAARHQAAKAKAKGKGRPKGKGKRRARRRRSRRRRRRRGGKRKKPKKPKKKKKKKGGKKKKVPQVKAPKFRKVCQKTRVGTQKCRLLNVKKVCRKGKQCSVMITELKDVCKKNKWGILICRKVAFAKRCRNEVCTKIPVRRFCRFTTAGDKICKVLRVQRICPGNKFFKRVNIFGNRKGRRRIVKASASTKAALGPPKKKKAKPKKKKAKTKSTPKSTAQGKSTTAVPTAKGAAKTNTTRAQSVKGAAGVKKAKLKRKRRRSSLIRTLKSPIEHRLNPAFINPKRCVVVPVKKVCRYVKKCTKKRSKAGRCGKGLALKLKNAAKMNPKTPRGRSRRQLGVKSNQTVKSETKKKKTGKRKGRSGKRRRRRLGKNKRRIRWMPKRFRKDLVIKCQLVPHFDAIYSPKCCKRKKKIRTKPKRKRPVRRKKHAREKPEVVQDSSFDLLQKSNDDED